VADQGHLEPQDGLGGAGAGPVVLAPQEPAQAEERLRGGLVDDIFPCGAQQLAEGGVVEAGQVAQLGFVGLDLAGGIGPRGAAGAELGGAAQQALRAGGQRGHGRYHGFR
jgi:hypothetical protein